MHQSKVRQSFQILYFRRFLTRSAQADNQILHIKSMEKHYSWQMKKTLAYQTELGLGGIKCLTRLCSLQPNLHKVHWQFCPGVHNLPTCLIMTRAGPSTAPPQPLWNQHLFCKNTKLLINWRLEHLITFHFSFLTTILLIDTKPCYFILRKVCLF